MWEHGQETPAAPAVRSGRTLVAPAVAFGAVAAATGYVATVSPDQPGHYPVCPFLRATGWWCPACGGLRCVHALTQGDLAAALHDNFLVVLCGTLAVLGWVRWTYRASRGLRTPVPEPGRARVWGLIVAILAFTVLRNTPWGSLLAPPRVDLSAL